MSGIYVHIADGIATITLDRPSASNSLSLEAYADFAQALYEIDQRDDVICTVWQAEGKYFCTGTDVKASRTKPDEQHLRQFTVEQGLKSIGDPSRLLYTHSKILVAALNGPAIGIGAAYLGHFDLIYAMPQAYVAAPFSNLGLGPETGASVAWVNRMGLGKATEALLFGRKVTAEQLERTGFVTKVFHDTSTAPAFHAAVRAHLLEQLDGLDQTALLTTKKLIRQGLNEKNDPDAVNMREFYSQTERLMSGEPAVRFKQIANKERRHKL
jgi:peroxisomal 3,2-trans-enoyl-CoA isomerase